MWFEGVGNSSSGKAISRIRIKHLENGWIFTAFGFRMALFFLSMLVHLIQCDVASETTTFDTGFANWTVENSSWKRINFTDLKATHPSMQTLSGLDKPKVVIVPNETFSNGLSVIQKDFAVKPNTSLEVYFTCFVLGWRGDSDPFTRMNNPTLQVLYDDVLVFHLESAISNNTSLTINKSWNQFKLLSSYKSNFTMRIRIMGSNGLSPASLIAIDSIVVKMTNNMTSNGSKGEEPEVDFHKKDGWSRVKSQSEEDEFFVAKNKSVPYKPEFCSFLPEKGSCKGSWMRYFYNSSSNQCEKFNYSGCNGNENNFHVQMACEIICQIPNKTEEDSLFDIIFLGPSSLNKLSNKSGNDPFDRDRPKNVTELSLSFDDGFRDWTNEYFRQITYIYGPLVTILPQNKSSICGASPMYQHDSRMRRAVMQHPIQLLPDSNLIIKFSLKLVGTINHILHMFFDNINPGFKIYVGEMLVFDYFISGEIDSIWHTYTVSKSTNSIIKSTHHQNPFQIIRIESWQSSGGRSYLILDDLFINQTKPNQEIKVKPKSESATPMKDYNPGPGPAIFNIMTKSNPLPFPCYMSKSEGPCRMNVERYFFDSQTKECIKFNYSGCKGNANNFQTIQDCYSKCNILPVNVCDQPRSYGSCKGYNEKYFYDAYSSSCTSFIYSGCGGNGNNFDSLQECSEKCPKQKSKGNPVTFAPSTAFPRKIEDCKLPLARGHCSDKVPMYGFDSLTSKCVSFTYGGCGGNGNRFFSRTSCESVCLSGKNLTTPTSTTRTTVTTSGSENSNSSNLIVTCDRPKKTTCINVQPSSYFYFNKLTNSCENETACAKSTPGKFVSQKSCENLCQVSKSKLDPLLCFLPPSEGPCGGKLKRYFYDPEEKRCLEFAFGGCKGNINNFDSPEDCEFACKGAEEKVVASLKSTICSLPKYPGPCSRKFKRFYFDNSTRTCQEFEYSGCGGNENQFLSLNDCKSLCLEPTPLTDKESSVYPVAESIIGVILIILLCCGGVLGYRYFKAYRERENYRIFSEQQRSGSVSSVAATVAHESQMSYENPVYSSVHDLNHQSSSIQMDTFRVETDQRMKNGDLH